MEQQIYRFKRVFASFRARFRRETIMTQLSPKLNINTKIPPELLTIIFHFLPYDDLNNALLVCRLDENIQL